MAAEGFAELFGRVTQVPRQQFNEQKRFVVLTPESNKKYNCLCPFFCPVQPDDTIYAVVKICDNNNLIITRPPFVQPSVTKENVIKSFVTMGKMGYNQAIKLYEETEKNKGDVLFYLSKLAEKWMSTKNPSLLVDFKLMTAKEAGFFLAKWHKQRNLRRLYLFGLTKKEIKACEIDTDEIYKRCMENPMSLYGIEIKKAIEIMMRNNKQPQKEDVRCGQILRTIHKNSKERGWSGTPSNSVLKLYPDYPNLIDRLHTEFNLVGEYHTAFLRKYARTEQCVAEYLIEMMENNEDIISDPYFGDDITLNAEQREAVRVALSSGLSIITGGPGTGKTTVLRIIVDNLELHDHNFFLCSFTGKAVSRIKEVTGREAYTIHQLINKLKKWDVYESGIKLEMLVIDEFSMVTTPLFFELLKVMKSYELPWPKVVFVGDVDQLPPIDWGDLALEIMKIPEIPKVELMTNMRVYKCLNGETDGILTALSTMRKRAKEDRDNKFRRSARPKKEVKELVEYEPGFNDPFDDLDPDDLEEMMEARKFKKEGPFQEADNFFIYPGDVNMIYEIIIDVHQRGLKQDDITILSPYNRDLPDLNNKFEQIFHEDKPYVIDHWKNKWHIGSRVICLENNYSLPIYNGTEGVVDDFTDDVLKVKIKETKIVKNDEGKKEKITMEVIHDIPMKPKISKRNPPLDPDTGEPIEMEEFNTSKFALSYALTVHKFQGSESPFIAVYIPPDKGSSSFINRNLIYTAISRGKRAVWVIGNIQAFYDSLEIGLPYRHNTLAIRMRELIDKRNKIDIGDNRHLSERKETVQEFIAGVD